jgi:hypothetical protein
MKPIKSNVSVDNNPIPISDTSVGDHHKHRNLLAHAPERLHDEITADYTDMIHAGSPEDIEKRRKAFIRKWWLKHRAVAGSRRCGHHEWRFGIQPLLLRGRPQSFILLIQRAGKDLL